MNIISEIHLKKEHFVIPSTFVGAGYKSLVICGMAEIKSNEDIAFFETKNVSKSIYHIVFEYKAVLKKFLNEEPEVIMFYHYNILVSAFIIMYRIFKPFNNTVWIIFTDFDTDDQHNFKMGVRKLGWIINSVFANFVTVQSSCHKDILSKYVRKNKIIPLQQSFSSKYFNPIKYGDYKRERKILCVCRVIREKGLEVLIRSFAKISDKFSDWRIHIVGPIDDAIYWRGLITLINESCVNQNFIFTGMLVGEPLKEEYKSASIFCLPSFNESLGISRYEAAINGIPVITSDAGCANDLASAGMQVFKRGDVAALVGLLGDLMESEELRISISNKQLESIKSLEENVLDTIKTINEPPSSKR